MLNANVTNKLNDKIRSIVCILLTSSMDIVEPKMLPELRARIIPAIPAIMPIPIYIR